MAERDLFVYYQRWQALDALIRDSYNYYKAFSGNDPDHQLPRQATILYLLQCLQEFAAGQFQFFYYGFEPGKPNRNGHDPLLQTWDEFPPEDILTAVLDQIGHDLDLIQQAANQRLPGNTTMRDTLATADRLAWLALAPAMARPGPNDTATAKTPENTKFPKLIQEPTTVLTYFEKAAEFYTIPYADVALIAIPFTATMASQANNHQDFLAIPHEVGHYVFRHLSDDVMTILNNLPDKVDIPDDYRKWFKAIFEELCADIYGCLIGGPVMAVDFANLSLANSQPDFRAGDALHPNPALRPLIYCQVLANANVRNWTDGDWSQLAQLLSVQWDIRLRERHVTEFIVKVTKPDGLKQIVDPQPHNIATDLKPIVLQPALLAGSAPAPKPDLGHLGNAVTSVVDALLNGLMEYLEKTGQPREPHNLTGWAGKVDETYTPDDLMTKLEDWFRDDRNLGDPPPDIALGGLEAPNAKLHAPPSWLAWVRGCNQFKPDPWRQKKPALILSGEVRNADQLQLGTWGKILYADGWTVGGPGIDHGHPAD